MPEIFNQYVGVNIHTLIDENNHQANRRKD